ncbi:GDSL-type esterase/lipase family protein [Streptomyces sp. NPDC008092]|uniref:SGNH/GDSL hydrolase family protein n=1 Tax=Streptomyces sp. NPDC008092 TaxID=3364808 RepID=UPI0036E99CD0
MTGRFAGLLGVAAVLLTTVACQTGPATAAPVGQPSAQPSAQSAARSTPSSARSAQPSSRSARPPAGSVAAARHDVVTWGASADQLGQGTADRGYRLVVHTSAAGSDLRVRLSNAFGDRPLTLDSVYAGLQSQGAALKPGSNRRLTFDGARTVTVPAGATAWSDPLPGTLPAGSNLVVSLHSPDAAGPATGHGMAMQTSYVAQGDHTAEEGAANWTDTTGSWWYLDSVSVRPKNPDTGAVVALGDSITDGWASTSDQNRRWPDYLARRLQKADTEVKGVADEGISGNKVLADGAGQAALNRLDRDVLSQPGVRTVFLFEGVNDIKAHSGVTAADLIAGYREIARRAHAAGKCVVASTVGPFEGWPEWDQAGEAVRQQVNQYIRTSGEFDGIADFDRILRSPYDQARMLPFLDGGDHIHPNDKGMQAMADSVDLAGLNCDH